MTIETQITTLQNQLNNQTTAKNTAEKNITAINTRLARLQALKKVLDEDAYLSSIITVA